MSPFEIRRAELDDIPRILPLIAKICAFHQALDPAKFGFLPHPELHYEEWLRRVVSRDRDLCLVAEIPSDKSEAELTLGAFLIATVEREIPIYTLRQYGFIHDVWVEEAYQHAGIARQMVMQTITHFQQLGIPQIRLDTAIANEAARELFTACGFRVSTVEMLLELS